MSPEESVELTIWHMISPGEFDELINKCYQILFHSILSLMSPSESRGVRLVNEFF